ncbi:hypothetical protein AK830_g7030 [Neonectria ditissima]|uniref:Uncharacterized protein n=1 Tax=Neonectria ditissima TaxID=78410 RepID=A0A0P7B0M7_9HYPO|nr:hypothetical protein AK830_g7030 [Neonectria ditissima]
MPKHTWFLSPDFTFFPEGELRLGMLLKYPDRPTLALASLSPEETPEIPLPAVNIITEPGHAHSAGSGRSAGANIFAKFVGLASASGSADVSRYKDVEFGAVDHEVRSFSRAPSPEALQAIVQLDAVKKFSNSGPFGRIRKRPVYLLSGLRVVKDSLSVTNTTGSTTSVTTEASASAASLGAPVPVELGGGVSTTGEKHESHSYNTAPGIVFAYRLHIIRPKSEGKADSELFSDKAAFFTGGKEDDDDEEQEMELAGVTGDMIKDQGQKGLKSTVEEYNVGDDAVVVFKHK